MRATSDPDSRLVFRRPSPAHLTKMGYESYSACRIEICICSVYIPRAVPYRITISPLISNSSVPWDNSALRKRKAPSHPTRNQNRPPGQGISHQEGRLRFAPRNRMANLGARRELPSVWYGLVQLSTLSLLQLPLQCALRQMRPVTQLRTAMALCRGIPTSPHPVSKLINRLR
ncbi:hypothetical protein BDP55DRAFT_355628 [Colletotrichum godetiae]|uniref:Uncharacterized protein n=1 Tax=Colletotrichum godetiae TaxID=1209918 RepID=A0AAJ0EN54_9PEZI|nr:uncharacterized protein BDP55DRAFT_355628 [Colletotrichum godetiae]KAK1659430.1 hypothetical protein BDP55DRAFT_355628 [Colletotrichum godetiae]